MSKVNTATIKTVVIGSGSIGTRHAQNLKTLGADVTQISWREHGYDGTLKLLDREQPDAAVIATATDIRLPLIAACAERDIALYIEKPLDFTAAGVAKIFDVAKPVAQRSCVGFMMRYHPLTRALAELDMGAAYRFSFEIGHDVTQWRQNWSFAQSYAARPMGGGVLLDLCHELDLAQIVIPDLSLDCVESTGHAEFEGVDMASTCYLKTPFGTGTVAMDYLNPVSTRRISLRSLTASVEADFVASTLLYDDGRGPSKRHFDFDRNDMFLAAMADFLALVAGEAAPSGLANVPRLDQTRAVCDLIATAWEARQFTSTTMKSLK